jgi:hypothetical protein
MSPHLSCKERPHYWIAGIVGLGLGLRVYHYGRVPSVWHDEAALIVSVLDRDFRELLGPLCWGEAAPPLFLWLERAVLLLLSDSVFALRLLPLLASCLALLLFQGLARRLLAPAGAITAVLLFAASDRLLWHACEAKPYAIDVLLAVGVLSLHVTTQSWPLGRQLLVRALPAPALIFLSYPGVFLCGASLLASLPAVLRDRRPRILLGYSLWTACVFSAFALVVLGPARAQRCPEMEACWAGHFPDWSRPWSVPGWTLLATLEVVRYCFKPLGQLLAPLALTGGFLWWREGRRALVVVLVVPLALAWTAACLHEYPYGASRLEVFAAPGLALLIGAGIVPALAWLRARQAWLPLVPLLLVAMAPLLSLYRAAIPWPRPDGGRAAAYIRARQDPDDAIAGNKWEHVYYFRDSAAFTLLWDEPLPHPRGCRVAARQEFEPPGRCWIILCDDAPERRRLPVVGKLADRPVLERREFEGTTIFLLAAQQ